MSPSWLGSKAASHGVIVGARNWVFTSSDSSTQQRQQTESRRKLLSFKSTPSDILPLPTPYFINLPKQWAPAGHQVFRYLNLWKTFLPKKRKVVCREQANIKKKIVVTPCNQEVRITWISQFFVLQTEKASNITNRNESVKALGRTGSLDYYDMNFCVALPPPIPNLKDFFPVS